jgi:hypothetical protein
LDFARAEETYNNLGGFAGGETVSCTAAASNLVCPDPTLVKNCGCGCRCTNAAAFAIQPPVLKYSKVGKYYDGTGNTPKEMDLVVAMDPAGGS